jgi:hypothetical protein
MRNLSVPVLFIVAFLLATSVAVTALPQTPLLITMKQLMVDLIHPASNEILLQVNRGGPSSEKDWAALRQAALTLEVSGRALLEPGRTRPQQEWTENARTLIRAGAAAYQAAQARDVKALSSAAEAIDASCTDCHRQFRPNVFPNVVPRQGETK